MEVKNSLDETLTSGSKRVTRGRGRRASEPSRASPRVTPGSLSKTSTSPLTDNEEVGNIDIVPSARSATLSESEDDPYLNLSDFVQQSCPEYQNSKEQIRLGCHTRLYNDSVQTDFNQTGQYRTTAISIQSNIWTIPGTSQSMNDTLLSGDTFVDYKEERLKISRKLKDNLFQLRRFRLENNEDNLTTHLKRSVQEAEKYTKELVKIIKQKHKQFVDEINGIFEPIFEMIQICDKKIENVLLDIETIEKPRDPDERVDPDAYLKLLRDIQAKNAQEYTDFETKRQALRPVAGLTFSGNKELRNILKKTDLGKMVTGNTNHNSLSGFFPLNETGFDIATNRLLTAENVDVCIEQQNNNEFGTIRRLTEGLRPNTDTLKYISCWTEGDYGSKTCITDLVKTNQDAILITDNNNKKLKLLKIINDELDVCGCVDLGGEPWQIAPYIDNKYVVTILVDEDEIDQTNDEGKSSMSSCVIVDALGFLSIERSFRLPKESTGVAVSGNDFIFCGYDGETAHIFVTDRDGNVLSINTYCGKTGLKRPNYLCVSDDRALLYVSDADRGVFGFRTDNLGEILFRFEGKPKMRCPLGMTSCSEGDLLICASQSYSLYRMSKDGKSKGEIKVGLRGIQSVCMISKSLAVVSGAERGYELIMFNI